ncbi:hypothetical protein CDD83_10541 [Cordyceps sp. RAO-2017]|nr:hypothetical protein CDD83_10541 [Cordyceps sp. RAO-2017]
MNQPPYPSEKPSGPPGPWSGPAPPISPAPLATTGDDAGSFHGGSYRINHRDTNSVLSLHLASGCRIDAKPGAMIAMSPTVSLRGQVKISLKKVVAGGDFSSSTYTGPGELLLAPATPGDVAPIRLAGEGAWSVGRDAYLAATEGVMRDYKRQGLGKALFSGESLFLYRVSGHGVVWVTSFGAIIRKHLASGEEYIVDNGHLVAWNAKYAIERVSSGSLMSAFVSGEGFVCRFTGPGTVLLQTRNLDSFVSYVRAGMGE